MLLDKTQTTVYANSAGLKSLCIASGLQQIYKRSYQPFFKIINLPDLKQKSTAHKRHAF
ncbi:hypothetical protein PPAR_a2000 [Pseudoalteromonas paragorgicola KMM 3548]|nr:hypothetical protein [Pseudoalteromonas distincta KMM 3548]